MSLLTLLFVAIGGSLGAPARFAVDRFVNDRVEADFPLGTFIINISGSFVLGLLTGLAITGHMPVLVRALLGTGFCGAYTTFSTWSFETIRLVEEDELLEAGLNVVLSLVVGLLAAGAGVAIVLALR
jgi:CrcB protein